MQAHNTSAGPLHCLQWHFDYRTPEPGQQNQSRIEVQVASLQTQDHEGADQSLQHSVRAAQPAGSR